MTTSGAGQDLESSGHAAEAAEPASILDGTGEHRPPRRPAKLRRWLGPALALLAVVLAAGLWFAWRARQERKIVAESVHRAEALARADTWLGYHEAAALLGVRAVALDPIEAGGLRAYALAMLALDYRDDEAAAKADAALRAPLRAATVPAWAELAVAALALRDGKAGTALEYASRGGESPAAHVLQARIALLAGNVALASESLEKALAADAELPAALALRADLLRRSGHPDQAAESARAALDASARALATGLAGSHVRGDARGTHARAAFGLAKLALSREIAPERATQPLAELLQDAQGSPQLERARAGLYLAALQGRGGDRAAAAASLEATGLQGELRAWLERAAGQLEVAPGRYAVVEGTPAALVSASDDDPYVPPPPPAPAPPPAPRTKLFGFKVSGVETPARPPPRTTHPHGKKRAR